MRLTSLTIAVAATLAAAAHAQEPPPATTPVPSIARHALRATIDGSGVARVEVDIAIRNPGPTEAEFELVFPASETAVLDSFHLIGPGGKPIPGRMYPVAEARAKYEEIVRRRRDPALLEFAGRALFHARLFPVPARGESALRLTYSEALRTSEGMYRFEYALPADSIEIILTGRPVSVYSPTHAFAAPGPDRLRWSRAESEIEPPGELVLFIVPPSEAPVDARVIAYRPRGAPDGHFLLVVSPNLAAPPVEVGKNIVLVFDRSGSMAGRKIEQARGALRHVLSSLSPADRFNVVAYNDGLAPFAPALVNCTAESRDAALRFVDLMTAEGGTNIHDALRLALVQLPRDGRPNVVVFLTDGIPTIGAVREPKALLASVRAANPGLARVFVFGVGHDVDGKFLDQLALEQRGIADYVAPAEDIEAKISAFYGTIRHPVLTDLRVSFRAPTGVAFEAFDLYPRDLPDLFRGRPLVFAGRFRTPAPGPCAVEIAIEGTLAGERKRLAYVADFAGRPENAFVARLWATRRVGALVDDVRLHGPSEEVVREIVRLGTEYGILTEYTSFLVEENGIFDLTAANVARCEEALRGRTAAASGPAGFSQAANTKRWQRADQVGAENAWRDDAGRAQKVSAVANLGRKTLVRRGGRWIDREAVTEQAVVTDIRLFSEEYFALARRGGEIAKALALGAEVTIAVHGKVYRVVAE